MHYLSHLMSNRAFKNSQNTHTEQWNTTESPEINTHIHRQLIYDKGAKNI